MHAQQSATDAVDLIFCDGGDEERSIRRRILRARDSSTIRAWQPQRPERARFLYNFASEWASSTGLAPATVDELQQVLRGLTALFIAASVLEQASRTEADE